MAKCCKIFYLEWFIFQSLTYAFSMNYGPKMLYWWYGNLFKQINIEKKVSDLTMGNNKNWSVLSVFLVFLLTQKPVKVDLFKLCSKIYITHFEAEDLCKGDNVCKRRKLFFFFSHTITEEEKHISGKISWYLSILFWSFLKQKELGEKFLTGSNSSLCQQMLSLYFVQIL